MSEQAAPDGWLEGTIGQIANVNPSVSLASLERDALVSFVTMADVSESGRIVNRQVRPLHQVRTGFTRFQEGDTLFAKITPCMENGKGAIATNLANAHGFGSTEFHVLRANESGDPSFLYHLSLSKEVRTKALAFFTGSAGQQRVDAQFFNRYSLRIPPVTEQRKIARILTTLDELIEKTEALIAKYQAIKQGMMHDLFTRGVDEHGLLRPTYDEAPKLYKESELGWIPKEWRFSTLDAVSDRVIVGLALSTTHAYRDKGVPLIRNQNIRRGYFEDHDMLYLDPQFAEMFPSKALRLHDVLTVRTGANVGDTATVPPEYVGCLTFTTLITSPSVDSLNSGYLVNYIASEYGARELNRLLVGGGKENLNVGEFVKLRIPLPPVYEQVRIVKSLEAIDKKLDSERVILHKCQQQKTGLMQDLLTGKVRVKPDEGAEDV